ncbi:hypothetical protein AJ78_07366 [Emergomyces pasteurianus Ep9510]|uniref:Protein kinase domain-containing protein n=1 Tax=Emergomyces pasteurianus Ep9510 TaxID=1447872 RepID=A0A1J9Q9V9_9EURO|nr:hypothetical protein AJ78_07366 [Emergomyces pasteurianus Ep9510]
MAIGPAGSIYQKEAGFNKDLKIDIDPLKTKFIRELSFRDFHNNGDPGYASDGVRDLNRSRCEIRAYCNLERFRICDSGYVPKFYRFILSLNSISFAPYLDAFQRDDSLSSAILIEYLPSPLMMNCITYSKERMNKAVIGIQQIHSALIEHNDSYPKNILIIPGDLERVV